MSATLSTSDEAARARSELARHAITTRWAGTTPEQRRQATLPGRLSGAVRLVTEHQDQLTAEQRDQLLDVALGGAA